jgi:fructose-1,6-bisphosphatase II
VAATEGTGIDAMVGFAGQQEILVTACVVRALGGDIQARLWPLNQPEREVAGDQLRRVFMLPDLSPGVVEAAVTGVTDSELLPAVHYSSKPWVTQSLAMSTLSDTVLWVRSVDRRVRGRPAG